MLRLYRGAVHDSRDSGPKWGCWYS